MMYIIDVIVGVALGIVASKILFVGQWYSLIIWAVVGFVLGYFAKTKKQAALIGSIYGFFLFFVFMVAGYSGSRSLIAVLPFFILIGIVGIIFGNMFSFAAFFSKKLLKKK